MRILIDYRPALSKRTGVGMWIHSLVKALTDNESLAIPVDLTIFSSSWKDRLTQTLPGTTTIDRRIPVTVLNYCWNRLEWPPVELLARKNFDVVHSPHPLLIPSRHAAQVITIHDLDFLDNPERTRAEIRRDYSRLVMDHAHLATHIVVPSNYTGNQVEQRLGIKPEKITVCPNGAPSWPKRTHYPKDGHILFVGEITPRKNVGTLINAYSQLIKKRPDTPMLLLAGPVIPQSAEWETAIKEPPLRGRVICTGYLTRERLKEYYENARVLVLPSFNEGFGIPVLEAMTIGVPVIVANRGALPEVAGNAGLLIEPNRIDMLTEALERMLTDNAFVHSCIEKGLLQATKYSWSASAEKLRYVYKKAFETAKVKSRLEPN